MLAPDAHPVLPADLLACHECDLLQTEPQLAPGQTASCGRCGAFLARNPPDSIDRTLALTVTASCSSSWVKWNQPIETLGAPQHTTTTSVLAICSFRAENSFSATSGNGGL